MREYRFGTAMNCIDGRVQEPVSQWLRATYHLDYVDVITESGPDQALLSGAETVEQIKSKVLISMKLHGSSVVALAGHHDCAGNPVSKEDHWEHIRRSLQVIRLWNLPMTLVGLWVNERREVEVVGG
jgi:hypothetical protein